MSNWVAYAGRKTLLWEGVTWVVKLPFRATKVVSDTVSNIHDALAAPFNAPTTGKAMSEWAKTLLFRSWIGLPIDALKNIRTWLDPYMPGFVAKTVDYVHNFKDYLLMEKWKTRKEGLKKFRSNIKGKWSNKSKKDIDNPPS